MRLKSSKAGLHIPLSLQWLLVQTLFYTSCGATAIVVKQSPLLRPGSRGYLERARSEARAQSELPVERVSCGDAYGRHVDIPSLVQNAVEAGLPSASASGVVFMQATAVDSDGCGPYTCVVSSDATGQSWSRMTIIQDVPDINEGCALPESSSSYTLVAKLPDDTVCSGAGNSCLIMCKPMDAIIGSCAAITLSKATTSVQQETSIPNLSTEARVTTSYTSQTKGTTIFQSPALSNIVSPTATAEQADLTSGPVSTKSSTPIQGFSGENGPGGPMEQHVSFGREQVIASSDKSSEQASSTSRRCSSWIRMLAAVVATTLLVAVA